LMTMRGHLFTRFGLIATLALLLTVLIGACGDDDDGDSGGGPDKVTEVRIGTQPWIGYGPFWIADERGFDSDNGVNIKLVNFTGREGLESGFASGRFEAANNATNDSIRLAALGIDLKVVLMEDFSLEADAIISCNPEVRSLEDVEGRTVAYEELSVSDLLFRYAFEQAGLDFDTIDYTPAPPDEAATAVTAGRVDVATTYQPYLQKALDEGENCKILYTAAERPGIISDGLAFNTEFAEENPEAVVGVLRAWDDAVDFYNENTEQAQAIIAENVDSKPAELEVVWKGVRLFDLEESQDFLEKDYEKLWNDVASTMVEQGQIESKPATKDYLDTSFGRKALE
jgi:NitT/TauT family transport system substrate-binding protein